MERFQMLSRLFVLFLLRTTLASATRVKINNYCPQQLFITETTSDGLTPLCKLTSGFSCYKDYTKGDGLFQNGYNNSVTVVAVTINQGGSDYYDIRTNSGFDLPLQISSSSGGPTFTCTDPKCPDALNNDSTKMGQVKTEGVITVNFCPYNMEAFATSELKLIETIQKPLAINPKHKPAIEKEDIKKT